MDSQNFHFDRLVKAKEALHLLGIGSTTLYKLSRTGRLNPVRYSNRCVRYRMSEIQALISGDTGREVT